MARALHRRIRTLREARELTQLELAKKCGVDASAVAHWESGATAPRPKRLAKIAKALDVTLAELFGEVAA